MTAKSRKDIRNYIEQKQEEERKKTKYSLLIPSKLSRSWLITNCPADVEIERWVSGAWYIAQTLVDLTSKKKFTAGGRTFVPLHSLILKAVLGRPYKTILDHLVKLKVIECDGKYSAGVKTYGYKLTNKYRGVPLKSRHINDAQVIKGIKKRSIERLEQQKERLKDLSHLARWAIDGKLKIDKKAALEYLEKDFKPRMEQMLSAKSIKPEAKDKMVKFVNDRYYVAVNRVQSFNDAKIYVDSAGGRLYSNLTNLMSPLRDFVTYDGRELVSIDLKNSQPLHFLLLLRKDFWEVTGKVSDLRLANLDNNLFDYLRSKKEVSRLHMMFHRSAETLMQQGEGEFTFAFLVRSGKLYEFNSNKFTGRVAKINGSDRFDTRSKAKVEVLRMMYFDDKNKYSPAQETFKLFEEYFPVEADVMRVLKSKDYKDFPVLLQKVEAKVMLHMVCKAIFVQHPNVPLFTIHDSILTTRENAETVRKILEAVYHSILGFVPRTESKELSPDHAHVGVRKYVKEKIDQSKIEILEEVAPATATTNAGNLRRLKTIVPKKLPFPDLQKELQQFLMYGDKTMLSPEQLAQFGIIELPDWFTSSDETENPFERKLKK